jgi:hypothetical protein
MANDPFYRRFRLIFRPPVGRPRFIGYAKINKTGFYAIFAFFSRGDLESQIPRL